MSHKSLCSTDPFSKNHLNPQLDFEQGYDAPATRLHSFDSSRSNLHSPLTSVGTLHAPYVRLKTTAEPTRLNLTHSYTNQPVPIIPPPQTLDPTRSTTMDSDLNKVLDQIWNFLDLKTRHKQDWNKKHIGLHLLTASTARGHRPEKMEKRRLFLFLALSLSFFHKVDQWDLIQRTNFLSSPK